MTMEKFVERELTGETQVVGDNLPQYHFSITKFIRQIQNRTHAAAFGILRIAASDKSRATAALVHSLSNSLFSIIL